MKMNKKKINKFLSNLITFIILIQMSSSVMATTTPAMPGEVTTVLTEIINVLLTVAGIVCVFKIIQIGIKFMTASAADKSNAKTALIPWIIGTVVCFGASWIGGAVIDLFGDLPQKDVLSY